VTSASWSHIATSLQALIARSRALPPRWRRDQRLLLSRIHDVSCASSSVFVDASTRGNDLDCRFSVSPTADVEIGTEEPENKTRFGSIEIRSLQTAGRMTNQWPGIKGSRRCCARTQLRRWEGAIEPPVAVEQKCWTDPGKMPS
jgi:hypothetical protein